MLLKLSEVHFLVQAKAQGLRSWADGEKYRVANLKFQMRCVSDIIKLK